MTAFHFRPGVRENVSLLVGMMGGTGSGKTYSAMRLAAGICDGERFAVIDTEARRALHYADQFQFDHAELHPPFRPDAYADAIQAADKAGYKAIVVDSVSHVWAGEGGVLDWQEAELDRMAGQDWGKRERVKMAAWIKPKMAHKQMVQRLLQVRAHLILCFRAEEKVEMRKNPQTGKTEIVPKQSPVGLEGWLPICDKNLPFELTASFLMLASRPGIPQPIKLQRQHKFAFPDGQPIGEEAGKALAEWARGGNAPSVAANGLPPAAAAEHGGAEGGPGEAPDASFPGQGNDAAPPLFRIFKGERQGNYDATSAADWKEKMLTAVGAMKPTNVQQFMEMNRQHIQTVYDAGYQREVEDVETAAEARKEETA